MKCTGEGNCGGLPCDSAARDGINEPICESCGDEAFKGGLLCGSCLDEIVNRIKGPGETTK